MADLKSIVAEIETLDLDALKRLETVVASKILNKSGYKEAYNHNYEINKSEPKSVAIGFWKHLADVNLNFNAVPFEIVEEHFEREYNKLCKIRGSIQKLSEEETDEIFEAMEHRILLELYYTMQRHDFRAELEGSVNSLCQELWDRLIGSGRY